MFLRIIEIEDGSSVPLYLQEPLANGMNGSTQNTKNSIKISKVGIDTKM